MTANEPLNQYDNCQPKIADARDSADTAPDQAPAPGDKGPADVPSPGRPMGPRTAEGKERSRFNRVGHGAYLKASPYIVSGFLAEVREEVETFVDELVGDLAPRNALERAAGRDVALAFLSSVRLGKSEALALGNVLTPDVTDPVLTPDPLLARNPLHDHHFLVIDQLVGTDTFLTDIDFDNLVAPYSPYISWYSLTLFLVEKLGIDNHPVTKDCSAQPISEEGWRKAVARILEAKFGEPAAARAWVERQLKQTGIKSLPRRAEARAALNALVTLDSASRTRLRVDGHLSSAIRRYQDLRKLTDSLGKQLEITPAEAGSESDPKKGVLDQGVRDLLLSVPGMRHLVDPL